MINFELNFAEDVRYVWSCEDFFLAYGHVFEKIIFAIELL